MLGSSLESAWTWDPSIRRFLTILRLVVVEQPVLECTVGDGHDVHEHRPVDHAAEAEDCETREDAEVSKSE